MGYSLFFECVGGGGSRVGVTQTFHIEAGIQGKYDPAEIWDSIVRTSAPSDMCMKPTQMAKHISRYISPP